MTGIAVGIDIGTSYTKAAARTEDGTVVAISRLRSPQGSNLATRLREATEWWECLRNVIRDLLVAYPRSRGRVVSICVSGIAPTLTVFDATRPDSAHSILYSSLAELEKGEASSQDDPRLTEARLDALSRKASEQHFASPRISDLVGYINWRLTGVHTINSISLVEAGVNCDAKSCEIFAVTGNVARRLVAPGEQIGETTTLSAKELGIDAGIPVCGGCSDTMSSVVGAGLKRASETMLYLGTFGSFLRLEVDVDVLVNTTNCPRHPFRWLLSVPGLGPEIELFSSQLFDAVAPPNRLWALDQAAVHAPAGAGGSLFLVPRWKTGMTPVGRYELLSDRSGNIGNVPRQARAVLEGLAYAILAIGVHSGKAIKTGGGGARSHIWLDILSNVLKSEVLARDMTWEATGAADIAAGLAWRCALPMRPCYSSSAHSKLDQTIIDDNAQRAKECYRERQWL